MGTLGDRFSALGAGGSQGKLHRTAVFWGRRGACFTERVNIDPDEAGWRDSLSTSPQFAGRPEPVRQATYPTLDYEVDGRIARLTFNRPERGNTITADTPRDLAHAVERADLDPSVHVILLSGRGKGFCGGYDLGIYAENNTGEYDGGTGSRPDDVSGTVVDPLVQAANHNPVGYLGPDDRLRDDEPLHQGLRVAAARQQADGREAARLLRRRRHRHRAARRPGDRRRTTARSATRRPASGASRPPGSGRTGSATSAPSGCCSPATACRARKPPSGDWPSSPHRSTSSTSAPRTWCSGWRGCRSTS